MKRTIYVIKLFCWFILIIILMGIFIPQIFKMPVKGASESSYNPKSFWFYPWGKSITHKGVDIFARHGTLINSSTIGMVVYAGHNKIGGNVIYILGPKWRIHYYAHLQSITTKQYALVSTNSKIGTVGASGNAQGKAPHLHYAIVTLIPYIWRIDLAPQGWKKMFYLNPMDYFNEI